MKEVVQINAYQVVTLIKQCEFYLCSEFICLIVIGYHLGCAKMYGVVIRSSFMWFIKVRHFNMLTLLSFSSLSVKIIL